MAMAGFEPERPSCRSPGNIRRTSRAAVKHFRAAVHTFDHDGKLVASLTTPQASGGVTFSIRQSQKPRHQADGQRGLGNWSPRHFER